MDNIPTNIAGAHICKILTLNDYLLIDAGPYVILTDKIFQRDYIISNVSLNDIFEYIRVHKRNAYRSTDTADVVKHFNGLLIMDNKPTYDSQCHMYPVVVLVGSTKFKDDFIRVADELYSKGNIVLRMMHFGHVDGYTPDQKIMWDNMYRQMIDMCDRVYVINKNDYIGESTRAEIEYAKSLFKPIEYMEEHNDE